MDSPFVYWGKIIVLSGAVVAAIIYLVIYLNEQADLKAKENNSKKGDSIKREVHKTIDSVEEKPTPQLQSKSMEQKKEGDHYHVESHGQTGGITAGKIIIGELPIPPHENVIVEEFNNGLFFKLRPKQGQWNQPFVMIPYAEKDSCDYTFSNMANDMSFSSVGVEELNEGIRYIGTIYGFPNGAALRPATKDFFYTLSFNRVPSYFIFGDHSNLPAMVFLWKKK